MCTTFKSQLTTFLYKLATYLYNLQTHPHKLSNHPIFPDEDGSGGGGDKSKFDDSDKIPNHV